MRDWGETILFLGALLVVGTVVVCISLASVAFLIATFTGYPASVLGFLPLLGLSLMGWNGVIALYQNMMNA